MLAVPEGFKVGPLSRHCVGRGPRPVVEASLALPPVHFVDLQWVQLPNPHSLAVPERTLARPARDKRWRDPQWRRHHLAETYHRLCARPAAALTPALEQGVHAAGQDTAILRQWTDTFEQAARDTADPDLLSWADRLQHTTDNDPALACLTALLTHGQLTPTSRAWAHAYRGRRLYLTEHDQEALTELDHATTVDPHNHRALAYRGDVHRWLGHTDQAVTDLTAALALDPTDAWALAQRGAAHREAGRYEQAVTDLDAAIALDPTDARALAQPGATHREAGRYERRPGRSYRPRPHSRLGPRPAGGHPPGSRAIR